MSYEDFKMVKRLGEGAFGTVYLAKYNKGSSNLSKIIYKNIEETGGKLALKIYHENIKTDPLEESVELSLGLKHPNLMACYNFFYDRIVTDNNIYRTKSTIHLFVVLEYISGINLFKMVKMNKLNILEKISKDIGPQNEIFKGFTKQNLDMEKKMDIYLPQIISGLKYLHARKIIHCDIKHENIVVSEIEDEVRVKIIDYDFLSKNANEVKKGTPYFLSPEIYLRKNMSEKIDIWSLGVTVFYFIKGVYPFDAEDKTELKELVLSDFEPDYSNISPKYQIIIKGMLIKDPILRINLNELGNLL